MDKKVHEEDQQLATEGRLLVARLKQLGLYKEDPALMRREKRRLRRKKSRARKKATAEQQALMQAVPSASDSRKRRRDDDDGDSKVSKRKKLAVNVARQEMDKIHVTVKRKRDDSDGERQVCLKTKKRRKNTAAFTAAMDALADSFAAMSLYDPTEAMEVVSSGKKRKRRRKPRQKT